MIRSMTAFAVAEGPSPLGVLGCELRAVNHRYLDQSLRLPEELRRFEPRVRERLAERLARGKLDFSLRVQGEAQNGQLELDDTVLARMSAWHRQLASHFDDLAVQTTELLRYPGVLRRPAVDEAELEAALDALIERALDAFIATREREGTKLTAVIRERLDNIEAIIGQVRAWVPQIREALRQRLHDRLDALAQPVDAGRLEQELVLQVTRMDVDEELDRLDAHVAEARRILATDEPAGRRLDFLMQEFNREANTLGSKSVDTRTTNASVELKVLIEQMREQVQNIE